MNNISAAEAMELFARYGMDLPFLMDERDTEKLTEAEFAALRSGPNAWSPFGIGGSDASVIAGVNDYVTLTELHLEKAGLKAPEEKSEEARAILEAGHREEPRIFEDVYLDLCRDYGKDNVRIHAPKYMFGCGEKTESGNLKRPWMRLNIDGLVELCVDEKWMLYGLEIKTMNIMAQKGFAKARDWSEGIVPDAYYAQVQYYMSGLGLDAFFVVCKWGVHPDGRARVLVRRDENYIADLLEAADAFVAGLETGTLPDETEVRLPDRLFETYMNSVYAKKAEDRDRPVMELDDGYRDVIEELLDNEKKIIVRAEERLAMSKHRSSELLAELIPAFRETNALSFALSGTQTVYITAYPVCSRDAFDEAGVKADHPLEYAECSGKRGKSFGVFKKDMLKRKFPEVYEKYITRGETTGEYKVTISLYDHEKRVTLTRSKSKLTGMFEWSSTPGVPKHLPASEKEALEKKGA